MHFTLEDILNATAGRRAQLGSGGGFCGISTDSRSVKVGELFVALSGPHFDGHEFCHDAVMRGAQGVVVSRSVSLPSDVSVVQVPDCLRALGDIAAWWRKRFACPCVAITGSNGKSTTKEMVAAIVGAKGPLLKTEGNLNNLIGLPLTLFRLSEEHRVAVLEMGMNASGEIARMTEIANPDVALITNVTAAHLEKLHTVEAVAAAKGELFHSMRRDGTIVLNTEDPRVCAQAADFPGRVVRIGMQNGCDVQFAHMEQQEWHSMRLAIRVLGQEVSVSLPTTGTHNVMNALMALGAAVALDIDAQVAAERLSGFRPMPMRFEQVQLANGVRLINDCYNANPESMAAAFRAVGSAKRAGRFLLVLGDMLELGDAASQLHVQTGGCAVEQGAQRIWAFGDYAADIARGAVAAGLPADRVSVLEDVDALRSQVLAEMHSGDVLLVKGSRGMRLERVVDFLKQKVGHD